MDGTKERRIRSRIDTQQLLRDKFDAAVEGHNAALAKLQLAAADGLQETEFQQRFEVFQKRYLDIQQATLDDSCNLKAEVLRMDRECDRFAAGLPIYSYQSEIIASASQSQVSVVLGESGSGKSTQICQYLYENGLCDPQKKIVCTQPWRGAAISLGKQVTSQMKTKKGNLVRYQVAVGKKNRFKKQTKILFSTDHCLLSECLEDPLFSNYSVVVIDEAHERTIHTDLLLSLLKKCLPQRPDLKVVISSTATDPTVFQQFFGGCPVINIPGRMYPVDVFYAGANFASGIEYQQQVVEKVTQLHKTKDTGDILAFVVTPLDCEKCCDALSELEGSICIPLHGRVISKNYTNALAPISDRKRKIILATKCAETSIAIPGIRYVVDSGLVKEKQFDPGANSLKLVLTNISKSSANQRKARAGTIKGGECYRLYSSETFIAMKEISVPEILRDSLDQVVLRLIALGFTDPLTFDFFQRPLTHSLQRACSLLKSLGAISTDGSLTDLGAQIVRLPVDPKFAKFILLCCADGDGVGYTGIAMASMCIQGNQVFIQGTTEKERLSADERKSRFLDQRGDAFTLLNVFKEWNAQPDDLRRHWCLQNSIYSKLLKVAYTLVKDVHVCLDKELNIQQELTEEDVSAAQRNYLTCFFPSHICFYSGSEAVGYFVPQLQEYCALHPSSALFHCGSTPKVAIFGSILETSRKFLLTVTEVEAATRSFDGMSWVSDIYEEPLVGQYTLQAGLALQCHLYHRSCQTTQMLKNAFDASLPAPELQWSSDKRQSWKKTATLIVRPKDHQRAQEYIEVECLKPIKDHLLNKSIERQVMAGSDVRVHIGAGGEVVRCLMPNEFTDVKVLHNRSCDPSHLNEEKLREMLAPLGEITAVELLEGDPTVYGRVRFCQPSSAESAVNKDFALFHCSPILCTALAEVEVGGFQGSICVEWQRQPISDHAVVYLPDKVDTRFSRFAPFFLGNVLCVPKISDSRRSFLLKPIPTDCTVGMIQRNGPDFLQLGVSKTVIPKGAANQKIEDQIEIISGKVLPFLRGAGLSADSMKFVDIQESSRFVRCLINPCSESSCIKLLDSFDQHAISVRESGRRLMGVMKGRRLKFTLSLTYMCPISWPFYKRLQEDIEAICSQHNYAVCFQCNEGSSLGHLHCTSADTDLSGRKMLQQRLSNVISGYSLELLGMPSRTLLSGKRDVFLKEVEKLTGTVIEKDFRQHCLVIYGCDSKVQKAERNIGEWLRNCGAKSCRKAKIPLHGTGIPQGLKKLVLRKFKGDLSQLPNVTGSASVRLDLRTHEIWYTGTPEGFKTLEYEIHGLAKQATAKRPAEIETLCPICLDEMETKRVELTICGHYYCKVCLGDFITNAAGDKQFPLRCIRDDCNQLVCIDDIHVASEILHAAVESFVSKNEDYKFCPTPNCANIYRVTKVSQRYCCSLCSRVTCSCCHKAAHSMEATCAIDADSRAAEL